MSKSQKLPVAIWPTSGHGPRVVKSVMVHGELVEGATVRIDEVAGPLTISRLKGGEVRIIATPEIYDHLKKSGWEERTGH